MSIGTVGRASPGFRLVGWVAICTCGAMVTDRRGVQELANEITRLGWRYENRRWRCGAEYCGTHPVGEIPNPVYETAIGRGRIGRAGRGE